MKLLACLDMTDHAGSFHDIIPDWIDLNSVSLEFPENGGYPQSI
jgi:hypothetical protein